MIYCCCVSFSGSLIQKCSYVVSEPIVFFCWVEEEKERQTFGSACVLAMGSAFYKSPSAAFLT